MPPENRKRRQPKKTGPDTSTWSEADKAAYAKKKALETPIAEMALQVRVINTLEDNGVIMCSDLMKQTYEVLMGMKNFGDKTLTEVRDAIKALGLDPPTWAKPPKPVKLPRAKSQGNAIFGDMW